MKTFTITARDAKGKAIYESIAYVLVVTAGTENVRLGVHKDLTGSWVVSDPESGGKMANVNAYYKGVPCSSRHLGPKAAHQAAHQEVQALLELHGANKFLAVLAKGRAKAKAAA